MVNRTYGGNASGSILRIAIGILALITVMAAYTGVVAAQQSTPLAVQAQETTTTPPSPTTAPVGTQNTLPQQASSSALQIDETNELPAATVTNPQTVVVPATAQWVDTGVILLAGANLKITATGSWSPAPSMGTWGPDGSTQPNADNFLNLADIGFCSTCASTPVPHFAGLIGYIGDNPPAAGSYTSTSILPEAQKVFFVGSNFDNTTPSAGKLWLNFNDDAYSGYTVDNSGQVSATITTPPLLLVISPNGGENWEPGTTHRIHWTYTGSAGSRVRIELLKGGAFNRQIAPRAVGREGHGFYDWKINPAQTLGSDYKVRVTTSRTSSAYNDTSDGDFNISTTTTGLAFPLKGFTPYNASVTSIMDHSMTTPYTKDGIVRAFDGEEGNIIYGGWCYDSGGYQINETNYTSCQVAAYKNSNGSVFLEDYLTNYDDVYLYYDGHPGYDYSATSGTDIFAPANGTLCVALNNNENDTETGRLWRDPRNCPYLDAVNQTKSNWNGWHTFYIIHERLEINGVKGDYITVFLHSDGLESSIQTEIENNGYAEASKNQHIAEVGKKGSGAYHTHLEVFKRNNNAWDRVDPYGDGINNILWEYRN